MAYVMSVIVFSCRLAQCCLSILRNCRVALSNLRVKGHHRDRPSPCRPVLTADKTAFDLLSSFTPFSRQEMLFVPPPSPSPFPVCDVVGRRDQLFDSLLFGVLWSESVLFWQHCVRFSWPLDSRCLGLFDAALLLGTVRAGK